VPPYYDSLLAKLVVWGQDREQAIARGRIALDEFVVDGVVTNVAFHRALLNHPAFLEGEFTTNLLDRVGSAAFLAAASAA
jgi:acetyl-CoA carboxylase biotin carboxylase subunit